jgi:DNA adenine methylase
MAKSTQRKKTIKESTAIYDIDIVQPRLEAKPFIKWAGGKWQLLPAFNLHFPPRTAIKRYFEPFLGGAAVFFHLQHPHSFLSDSNAQLVELYQIVRNDVESLIKALSHHRNEEKYYYAIRALDAASLSPVERAARFIYLNRTCYNGLYRVNSQGQFNVPFGNYKNPRICDAHGLRAASLALQRANLRLADFETAVEETQRGDLIYFDPPYQPLSKTSSFTAYTSDRFGEEEQRRLARIFRDLDRRGCYVMLSNSSAPLIRELYSEYNLIEVLANRAINSKANGRGKIVELLITNF